MTSDELYTCLYIAIAAAATVAFFDLMNAYFDAWEAKKEREEEAKRKEQS